MSTKTLKKDKKLTKFNEYVFNNLMNRITIGKK